MATSDRAARRAWDEAMTALGNHAKLGLGLQTRGLQMLTDLKEATEGISPDVLQEARAFIREGVRIEAAARLEIYRLERNRPRWA